MTSVEIANLVGRTGTLTTRDSFGWFFERKVRIEDAREVFGRIDVLVRTTLDINKAEGPRWVDASRVILEGEA